ncbi:hypothetical protein ZIOFF_065027 [Zingiber officinale]|uniref:FHA domain-containing protein n=1 Tax=Zingiber officinale TaxID=94328 RepID=A0A8J5EZZ9_ZINOF|nr:hypothetical protein ZIOFF_065027 [Zingiber officinale]
MVLDITGKNHLSWILDAEIHLVANGLGDVIIKETKITDQGKAKEMILLRRHLYDALKIEYLIVKDPLVLWNNLKEMHDHLKTIILPKAQFDWLHLRLQDFKSISEYNSALFRIISQLKLCGETITDGDMLEKTFSTFHASNVLLQQQYRAKGFENYLALISCLLLPSGLVEHSCCSEELPSLPPSTSEGSPLRREDAPLKRCKRRKLVHAEIPIELVTSTKAPTSEVISLLDEAIDPAFIISPRAKTPSGFTRPRWPHQFSTTFNVPSAQTTNSPSTAPTSQILLRGRFTEVWENTGNQLSELTPKELVDEYSFIRTKYKKRRIEIENSVVAPVPSSEWLVRLETQLQKVQQLSQAELERTTSLKTVLETSEAKLHLEVALRANLKVELSEKIVEIDHLSWQLKAETGRFSSQLKEQKAAHEAELGAQVSEGEDFEYYMQTYSILLGRSSKTSEVDVDLASMGSGLSISRCHARIFYDFPRRCFSLEVLGRNGCIVEGVHHQPGSPPIKLDSQDLIQMGEKMFYFLLPSQSIVDEAFPGDADDAHNDKGGGEEEGEETEEEEDEEGAAFAETGKFWKRKRIDFVDEHVGAVGHGRAAALGHSGQRQRAFGCLTEAYRGVIPFINTLFGGAKQDATLFVGGTEVCCVLDDRLDGMLEDEVT